MPNNVDNIVSELKKFSKTFSINFLFVVGDYPRNKIFNDKKVSSKIDVVSAHEGQINRLCGLFGSEFLKTSPIYSRTNQTGTIKIDGITIEFQEFSTNSYMNNEEVLLWMKKNRIDNSPLLNNVCGRDFTIGSIVLSLENGRFYDFTKKVADDIERKTIRTILPSSLIIKYSPIVALKAIYFACKYNFNIDPNLRKLIRTVQPSLKKAYSKERIEREIDKIMQINVKEGLKELGKYDLLSLVVPERLEKYLKMVNKK